MANEKRKNPLMVVLGTHRISYVHIKTPTAFEDGQDAKYDCTFLIEKDHPDVKKINDAIKASYAANKESVFKGAPLTSPKMWNPLRDGDEWLEEHPEASEYEGMYFLKAASKSQPQVYDIDKNEIFDLDEVYSGAYCRGVIVCYPFNNKSKGHGFYLNSLMKIDDGERLGGFAADPNDYDDEEEEAPKRGSINTKKRQPVEDDEDDAPPARRPAPKKAAAKVKRIWDVDDEGLDIYSDDEGETWFYSE